jgi:type VI secretion system protein VasD
MMKAIRVLALIAACLALAACGTPAVKVGVSSTANLNLNEESQPLPVVVRVYQLAESQRFEGATFEELWKDDMAVLGDSLVLKEELVMDPAYQKRLVMPRHDQARYIAAVAIFRDPDSGNWKAIDPLPNNYLSRRMSADVRIALKGNTVSIEH